MAERTIGLRIELNGFKGVVSSIKQLEEELNKAKQDLNEIEIGSAQFKELSQQISAADGKLQNLRKSSEGIGLEKQLEGYGKLAGGITSSFAAAQAAVALFGVESEAVTKAATQAQNLLTLGLAARGIQELGVGAQIVARTIAEKAAAAATATSNSALKALYATISANPIGALLTVLGALVAAMFAFKEETDDAAKAQEDFNDAINKDAGKNIATLDLLIAVINDTTASTKARKKAIDDLEKIFPAYFKDLNKEKILTGEVAIEVDKLKDAILRQAQARALQGRVEENAIAQLDLQDKITEATNRRIQAEQRLQEIQNTSTLAIGGGSVIGAPGGGAQTETIAINNLNNALEEETKVKDELNKVNEKLAADIAKITELNKANYSTVGDGTEGLDKDTKAKDNNVKATEAQIKAQKELDNQLKITNSEYDKTLARVQELIKTAQVQSPAPKIVEDLKAIVDARKALEDKSLQQVFKDLGFDVTIADGALIKLEDNLMKARDEFGLFYDDLREQLAGNALTASVQEFGNIVGNILNEASAKLSKGLITKEAFDALKLITDQYSQFNKLIQTTPEVRDVFDVESLNEFLKVTRDINIATGVIKFDYNDITGAITEVNKEGINLATSLQQQQTIISGFQTELETYYKAQYAAGLEQFKLSVNNAKITKEQRDDLIKAAEEGGDKINQVITDISKSQAEGVKTLIETIVTEENQIRSFLATIATLQQGTIVPVSEAIKKTLLENTDLLIKETQRANGIVLDETKTARQNLSSFEQQISKKGIDLTNFTEEEKLRLVKAYLAKQVQATQDAEALKREETKITIDDVQLALQVASQAISDIAGIAADSFSLQLDKLESNYNNTLSTIVGDTKEANDKRVELEAIYQKEKRAIEKKAQLTSLAFTLATTIAQGAQAFVNALATLPPPANAIVAGIQAAITAAQVAVVAKQIAFVQSQPLRRGGMLGSGGIVEGPSHENGGVYAGGGMFIEGNEAVINRQSTLQYAPLLSSINQQGGGRPILVSNPMDSRLVEAIAKQNTQPIRAYVVEQDITRVQTINRRLEQLASF